MEWPPTILYSVIIIFFGLIILESVRIIFLSRKAVKAGQVVTPASNENPNSNVKILVVGDSTSLGTGAKSPDKSLVGRLVKDFPECTIINASENALKIAQAKNKIVSLVGKEKFDIVILHLGGMDTVTLTSLNRIKIELEEIFTYLQKAGVEKTVLVSVNNTGAVPFFRFPLNSFYTYRSRCVSKQCHEAALSHSVIHIPLFTEAKDDPLYENDTWHVAPDKSHPNERGYEIWYEKIKPTIHQIIQSTKSTRK